METRLMKWLWYKLKSGWWKLILGFVVVASLLIYFYRLLNPAEDKIEYLEAIKTEAQVALTEANLRAKMEKDKIGAVKSVFENRLQDTRKINDREERLKALIRLHKELDL
jgi:type II secretory pathway component PulM